MLILKCCGGLWEAGQSLVCSRLPGQPEPHQGSPRTEVVGATGSTLGTASGVRCVRGKR